MATGDKRPVVMEADRAAANGVATLGEDKLLLPDQRPKADGLYMPDGTKTIKEAFDGMVHAVSQLVNPNLLDNWYFGNPVDQRQGRVVVPNTTYYSDNTLTTAAGTTSAYVTAYRYATGTANGVSYASFKLTDSDTAPTYYAAPENVVRGYTGAGYGPDRWIYAVGVSTILIRDGYIQLTNYLVQKFDIAFYNNPLTFSILYLDGTLGVTSDFLNKYSNCGYCDVQYVTAENAIYIVGTTDIVAVKLELGSQQTLAHQDENGVWQLNEIPDYGEQLARCQRHQFIPEGTLRSTQFKYEESTKRLYGQITFPVTMRTTPGLSLENAVMRDNTDGSYLTLSSANVEFMTRDGLWLIYNPVVKSGTFVDGHIYSFDSRIIFDANL